MSRASCTYVPLVKEQFDGPLAGERASVSVSIFSRILSNTSIVGLLIERVLDAS